MQLGMHTFCKFVQSGTTKVEPNGYFTFFVSNAVDAMPKRGFPEFISNLTKFLLINLRSIMTGVKKKGWEKMRSKLPLVSFFICSLRFALCSSNSILATSWKQTYWSIFIYIIDLCSFPYVFCSPLHALKTHKIIRTNREKSSWVACICVYFSVVGYDYN